MGSYWSVPYLTKKSVLIEPAVKHDTTEEKKATIAESIKEIIANDMLHTEPFVEIEEKRALTPILEEKTQTIETQTDVVEPVIEPVVEVKVEVKEDAKVEVKVEPVVEPIVEAEPVVQLVVEAEPFVQPVVAVEPVVEVEPLVEVEPVVEVEPLVEPVVAVEPAVEPVVDPVVAVEPVVKAESIPDLSSTIAPPNQFNSVSHAIKKSNKKNRRN
jgi:hypothetical protein